MYAGVKFHSDNTVSIVPIDHIKCFKLPVETNKTYQVFWSINPDEEPNPSHKNVDKIYKSLSNRKDDRASLPPDGYFNAKILCIADTIEETSEALNSLGLPLQKRCANRSTKASAKKLISSAAASTIRESMSENTLTFSDDDDTDADETVEPVKSYKEKLHFLESRNSKLEAENEMLRSQLMIAKEQLRKAEEEGQNISEKLNKTKEKYRNVKDEFKIARQLNYDLQRKLIASFNVVVSPDQIMSTSYEHSIPISKSMEEPLSPSLISVPGGSSATDAFINASTPCLSHRNRQTSDECEQPTKKTKLNDSHNLYETQHIFPTAEVAETLSFSLLGEKYFLSPDIIKSSSMGCRVGKEGDKVYVKNLAVNLFGKDILMTSSATGRKPPTGGKPARPALPKDGIAYIQHLLEQRVLCELNDKNDLTEEEKKLIIAQRSSTVVVIQAIGDKIATLRRATK